MDLSPEKLEKIVETASTRDIFLIMRELTKMKNIAERKFWSQMQGAKIGVRDGLYDIESDDLGTLEWIEESSFGTILLKVNWDSYLLTMRPVEVGKVILTNDLTVDEYDMLSGTTLTLSKTDVDHSTKP